MNAQTKPPARAVRKTWKKRTPAEVVLAEEAKLREEIAGMEADFTTKKRQLQKFAEARKIFESV